MPEFTRRTALRLGAGAAGAAALGRIAPLVPAGADPTAPTMVSGTFVSAARGGIPTNWAIARPPGQTRPLRPVIALHGKGSSAAAVMAGGVEGGLAQAVAAGLPPFAVVAVDGGGGYWHRRASGDDAGAMVLDELIPMLGQQGLDTSRVGFLGWSMGGYGALLLPHRGHLCGESGVVDIVGRRSAGRVRRARGFRREQCDGTAGAGIDPDPDRLRVQRPVLRRDEGLHRPVAQSSGRRILPRRARRRLLEFPTAR
jgi:hypothetical protein